MELHLNGLVVKPDEVLVVTLPGGSYADADAVAKALDEAGLGGRVVVLRGDDIELATVPRET